MKPETGCEPTSAGDYFVDEDPGHWWLQEMRAEPGPPGTGATGHRWPLGMGRMAGPQWAML